MAVFKSKVSVGHRHQEVTALMPIVWHITPVIHSAVVISTICFFDQRFPFHLSQGFLVEDKLLSLLAPLEKEEQTVVKLASLLTVSPCSVMHQWIVWRKS